MCAIMVVSALATCWPFQVRFALSRAALETEARRLLETPASKAGEELREGWVRFHLQHRVGVYTVQVVDVDHIRGHVYFSIGSVVRPAGLVYLGDSTEPPQEGERDRCLPREWGFFAYP